MRNTIYRLGLWATARARAYLSLAYLSLFLAAAATAALTTSMMVSVAHAQEPRAQADQRDVKKQLFLKRLPLQSNCKAEVTGGVILPSGEKKWQSGAFEVEAEDDFRVVISMIDQLSPPEQETCEAQARALEHDDVQRTMYLEKGDIVCMRRVFNDKGRLPQLTACRVSALLTQPTHLRCKNNEPILDPDGIFVSANLFMAMTLPQAAVTKGVCQASDRF